MANLRGGGAGSEQPGRMVLALMAGVVVSFLFAAGLAQYWQATIDDRVVSLVANALPSIRTLAEVRSTLRRLDARVTALAPGTSNGAEARETIEVDRREISALLSTYEALPFFPQEAALYRDGVVPGLRSVDQSLAQAVERANAGDRGGEALALVQAHRRITRLDDDLYGLINFDTAQGQRIGLEIANVHRQARSLALALDLASVFLAAVATIMVVRLLRRLFRAIEGKTRQAEGQAAESAERAAELEQFAGRVAHDLRGPLTSIALRTSAVQRDETVDEKTLSSLASVQQYVRRMDAMIEGLLEFARSGAHPRTGDRTNVHEVLDEIVQNYRDEATLVGAQVLMEPFPACEVACSRGALTSVVLNLLRNAIKYIGEGAGPDRRITVRVATLADRVRFEFEDTGPGIPVEEQQSIFEPYVRGTKTRSPGLGLGLATVRRIVEAHHGSVGVMSEPGAGSMFWFEIPSASPAGEPRSETLRESRTPN